MMQLFLRQNLWPMRTLKQFGHEKVVYYKRNIKGALQGRWYFGESMVEIELEAGFWIDLRGTQYHGILSSTAGMAFDLLQIFILTKQI